MIQNVQVRDSSLIQEVLKENERRGDKTVAKTLSDLARERLVQLEDRRKGEAASLPASPSPEPSAA